MKILITTTLILFTSFAHSQSWCDTGAKWKYSFFSVFYAEGYVEISHVGDTTINGQLANKLNKHYDIYSYFNSQYESYDFGEEYTYEDSGVVYIWYENNWDTLYSFNALVGESWTMAKQPINEVCDSNSVLTVTATGTKIINSIPLKYVVVDFNIPLGFSDTIVEKIGFTGSYMFPYEVCNASLDAVEGGPFRCYEDDNFPTYKPHYSNECDYVIGIEENQLAELIRIVPNPATNQINISGEFDPSYTVEIVNAYGKYCEAHKVKNTIDISDLPSGIYQLLILQNSSMSRHKFVVQ